MINAYDQGVSCDQGVESALGKNLASLEKGWKLDTFEKRKYINYIYILGGILLVLVISLGGFIFFKLKEPLEMELEPEEQELYEEEFEIPPPR
jgi:hypothetical protein